MTARRDHLDGGATALLLLLCAIWGLGQVVIKVGLTGVSPLFQAGLRSAGSAVLLAGWAAVRGVPLFRRDGTLGHGALIAALFGAELIFLYWGFVFTTAARGVLFLYSAPFVVAIGAHFLLPGERLRSTKLAGLACAFAGLALAFADGLRLPTYRELIGDGMELAAAILWGATTLAIKHNPRPIAPEKTLFYQLAGSALILFAGAAVSGEPGITDPTPLVLGALAYQIVIVAFASYLAWFWLLHHYPASNLAAFSFWTPIFSVIAGALLLGEPVTPALGVSVILIAMGIYLVNRP